MIKFDNLIPKSRVEVDSDLTFLQDANNKDLHILIDYLVKDRKGSFRLTESLSQTREFKKYYSHNLRAMVPQIQQELRLYGSNTFATLYRGGVPVNYKEILVDVAKKMKVNFNKFSSVETIEAHLLQKILLDSLDKISEKDLKQIADEIGVRVASFGKEALIAGIQIAIKNGGFAPYKIAVIVANAVAKALLGRGLSLAANAALTRWISIFAGPIGWLATAIWTAIDVAGPAYRVTIPAVIQVAYMRLKDKEDKQLAKATNTND